MNLLALSALALVITSFSLSASASPAIAQYGIGCKDGLCLWVTGRDLFKTTKDIKVENKDKYTFIDIYADADDKKQDRLARYHIYDRISASTREDGVQVISIKFEEPEVREKMMKSGVYFKIVNPESKSQQYWSQRVYLPWNRNRVVLFEDFETVPLSSGDNWGFPRSTLRDRKTFNPSGNPNLGWFNSTHAQSSRIESSAEQGRYLITKTKGGNFGPPNKTVVETKDKDGKITKEIVETGGGLVATTTFCESPPCQTACASGSCKEGEKPRMLSKGFEEAILTYKVNFKSCPGTDKPFDFRKGGKLPGLGGGSGGGASGGGGGGGGPNGRNSWSARSMFGSGASAILYLYHPDMRNPSVIPVPPGGDVSRYHRLDVINRTDNTLHYGQGFPYLNEDGQRFKFERNRWYMIEQRVRMNSVPSDTGKGNFDGEIEILVDGKRKLLVQNIRLRHGKKFKTADGDEGPKLLDIDSVSFHNFHGGNKASHAPYYDACTAFDDVRVFEPIRK